MPFLCNSAGFIQHKASKDAAADEFYQKLVASRAFDVFIEEEHGQQNLYHVRPDKLLCSVVTNTNTVTVTVTDTAIDRTIWELREGVSIQPKDYKLS